MKPEQVIKKLGADTASEMEAMGEEALKKVILDSTEIMWAAKDELESNPAYVELKENLKACTAGKKELDSRQRARIQYALELLQRFGRQS